MGKYPAWHWVIYLKTGYNCVWFMCLHLCFFGDKCEELVAVDKYRIGLLTDAPAACPHIEHMICESGKGSEVATAPAARASVLHIEADSFFADAIAQMVANWPEVCHLGIACGADDAVSRCRTAAPAVVISDLWLPASDGRGIVDRLAGLPQPPRMLLLTCRDDEVALRSAWFERGKIFGLIWKARGCHEHLRAGIAAAARGERYFPPEVGRAIHGFCASPNAFFKLLTPRQEQFMPAFARGATDDEIAGEFGVTPGAARTQRKRIMHKLGLHRACELAAWATEKGFGAGVALRRSGVGRLDVSK